jgi:acyl-CoA thioesterase
VSVPPAIRDLIARNPWARSLGIELQEIAKGSCRATLTLAPHMESFLGTADGSVIYALAHAALSAAANSHGDPAVTVSVTVNYLAAAAPGAHLVAMARQVKQGRRAGFYDVSVTTEDGRVVAVAHGIARRSGSRLR